MMLPLALLLLLLAPLSTSGEKKVPEAEVTNQVAKVDKYFTRSLDWIGERVLGVVDSFFPDARIGRAASIEGRKKKLKLNKFIMPLIVGFILIKSVILPLTLKALAILSGKAVVLSLMSLILAGIIGLRSVAYGGYAAQKKIDLVSKYRRKDIFDQAAEPYEDDPYRYYNDMRRRRR